MPGAYAHAGTILTFTDGDASNNNQLQLVGGESLLVRNSGVTGRLLTIVSAPDGFNRTRDISETLAAGEERVYGPFLPQGWRQTDGFLYVNPAHADLKLAVLVPLG